MIILIMMMAYIDDLITIRLDKTLYEYNFEEEFSQNCQRIPKLELIKEYININFPEINLDEVVRTVIVPGVLRNSGVIFMWLMIFGKVEKTILMGEIL